MTTTEDNRRIVSDAFAAWADGSGSVFDLLTDDARWTITGTSRLAGTYAGRPAFLDEAIAPIGQRLASAITPTVRSIVAEGDDVVVLFDGHATAADGQPYDNTYSWHLHLEGGRVTEVVAFFDTPSLEALFDRQPG